MKRGAVSRWLDGAVPEYVSEHAKSLAGDLEPKLTPQQHLDAVGVFASLKGAAAKGELGIGDDSASPAKIMKRLWYLIELRPKLTRGSRPPRLFRLYYAEPASIQDALLPLVLSTKPNDEDPHGEQNQSIDDAKARSRTWTLWQSVKGK